MLVVGVVVVTTATQANTTFNSNNEPLQLVSAAGEVGGYLGAGLVELVLALG